jgi:hypothetical protein
MIRKTSFIGSFQRRAVKQPTKTASNLHCLLPGECDRRTAPDLGAILPLHDVRYRACLAIDDAHAENVFLRTNQSPDREPAGGARRDRTDDLLLAKQALSQLSYGPDARGQISDVRARMPVSDIRHPTSELVGPGRFELPTSRLSSARSNQLSYEP